MLWIGFLLELTLYFELFFYSDVSRWKTAHSMRQLPAHYTFGWYSAGDEQCLVFFKHDVWNWGSPDQRILFLTVWGSFWCFFANSKCFFFTEERIESCHTTIKSRSMECCSNVCPSVRFSYLHIWSWSSTRVTIRFLVTSVDKALLHQLLSLARRPALEGVQAVSNFFHLRVTETTCFCEPSVKQNFFSELFPRCVAWCKLVSELYRQLFWPQGLVFALICIITC